MEAKVTIEVTLDQAKVLVKALDLYTRMGIGQVEEIGSLIRHGVIPREVSMVDHDKIHSAVNLLKDSVGLPWNGSYGLGHEKVSLSTHRAYEMEKVIDKAISVYQNPNPEFKGVNYDGLTVRYTEDRAPVCSVEGNGG